MKKILLVDDEEFLRKILGDILRDESYSVTAVPSATEGLEALRREAFDLILVDKQMPDLDGTVFISHVRSTNPVVKIILLTGTLDQHCIPEINGCLFKPVDINVLLRTVSDTISG